MPIVIIGADAMLAALPATPVQLAHACLSAGFANVIPVSWGDELIAAAMLRRLAPHGGPAVQCSCPKVAQRLLSAGSDLRPVMVPLVSPPVATARYLRSASQPTRIQITYVGACPGAVDDSIDTRITPEALLAMLAEQSIVLDEQPRVFEGVIPPDRRRFRSQPGGLPTADALWRAQGARSLIEIDGDDISTEIAQHILSGRTVLIDVSARLGCVCAGAIDEVDPSEARSQVVAHEPPRASTPVVNELEAIDLDLLVLTASRTPADIVAAVEPMGSSPSGGISASDIPVSAHPPAQAATNPAHHHSRISPTPGVPTIADPRPGRTTSPTPPRPVLGSIPVARGLDGKALPRAYIARRRPSPRGADSPSNAESAPHQDEEVQAEERAIAEPVNPRRASVDVSTRSQESVSVEAIPSAARPAPIAQTPTTTTTNSSAATPSPSPASFVARNIATRRPVWLIVLLIGALIAGIGVGVVVARSLGLQSVPSEAR